MRFPIKFSPVNSVLLRPLLAATSAYAEVGPEAVEVRMGYGFRGSFPLKSVTTATKVGRIPLTMGVGVHGWGGHWVVNGTLHDIVRIEIEPPGRGHVLGVPVKLRALWVSLEDPDGFLAAIGQ